MAETTSPRNGPPPDFALLRSVLLRERIPERLPSFEIFADPEFVAAALGETLVIARPDDPVSLFAWLDQYLRFWYRFGYDCVPFLVDMGIPIAWNPLPDTAEHNRGERGWRQEHSGTIGSLSDCAAFPWPHPGTLPMCGIRYLVDHLPPGMKLIPLLPSVLEFASALIGTERLFFALSDQPPLVAEVTARIGEHVVGATARLAALDGVGAICIGDDWGHRTGSLISPEAMRQYIFPATRLAVEATHAAGKPAILHSCGCIEAVMEEVIVDLGFDARHSFEENATPVTEAKQRWGDRIAILGGVDVDVLARATPAECRSYVRRILHSCAPGGGYAAGSGNSLANYIRVENFRIMLEEVAAYAS